MSGVCFGDESGPSRKSVFGRVLVRSNANEGSTPHNYASILPQAATIGGGMFENGIFLKSR